MVFAKERRTEEDVLVDRLTERPAARTARIRRKKVDPDLKRAIARLLAEDLDLSPADLGLPRPYVRQRCQGRSSTR